MSKSLFIVLLLTLVEFSFSQLSMEGIRSHVMGKLNASDECKQQYLQMDLESYFKMFDSSSKFLLGGIANGNFYDLGFYDECLSIHNKSHEISGKYCLATIPLSTIADYINKTFPHSPDLLEGIQRTKESIRNSSKLGMIDYKPSLLGYHFGVCLPNKCTTKELNDGPLLVFDDQFCYTKSKVHGMNIGSIIALIVVAAIVGVAIISTIYDIIIQYNDTDPKHEILVAFSMYTNGKKLIKISNNPDQLLCLNGIKALSMIWVILGHTYANLGLTAAINNFLFINEWMDDEKNMFIMSATVSVDTFFTVGGLLTVYTFMRTPKMGLKESFSKVPLMYLHRYLRLTPALAILILVHATGLIKYISDGPRWGSIQDQAISDCEDKWWQTLLYIQNYFSGNMCISQSWYLSVDMQLFLLTPFLLIPLRKWPKLVVFCMFILVLVGIYIPFQIGYDNKLSGLVFGSMTPSFSSEYYFKTHARFSPYVIGMLTGFYIYRMKKREKQLKLGILKASLLWTGTLVVLLVCIFDGYKLVKNTKDPLADGFYLGFNRSLWSCAVAILIVLCVTGNGGPVNWLLSVPFFQLLSKLSYSMYLVHYLIITVVNLSSRDTMQFSNSNAIFQFFAFFVITVIVSVFYCLIFESPMIIIEKLIFNRAKSRGNKKTNDERV